MLRYCETQTTSLPDMRHIKTKFKRIRRFFVMLTTFCRILSDDPCATYLNGQCTILWQKLVTYCPRTTTVSGIHAVIISGWLLSAGTIRQSSIRDIPMKYTIKTLLSIQCLLYVTSHAFKTNEYAFPLGYDYIQFLIFDTFLKRQTNLKMFSTLLLRSERAWSERA
jgi:hypothetical protein